MGSIREHIRTAMVEFTFTKKEFLAVISQQWDYMEGRNDDSS